MKRYLLIPLLLIAFMASGQDTIKPKNIVTGSLIIKVPAYDTSTKVAVFDKDGYLKFNRSAGGGSGSTDTTGWHIATKDSLLWSLKNSQIVPKKDTTHISIGSSDYVPYRFRLKGKSYFDSLVTVHSQLLVESSYTPFINIHTENNVYAPYLAFTPQGAYSPTNIAWTMGKKSTTENFSIAGYDGTTDRKILNVTPIGRVGIGNEAPDSTVKITGGLNTTGGAIVGGNLNVNKSIDIKGSISTGSDMFGLQLTGTFTGGASHHHVVSATTQHDLDAGWAVATFDAHNTTIGTHNVDHMAGFQARTAHASTGTLNYMYSFIDIPLNNGGTLAARYGLFLNDVAGTGSVTTNMGIYVNPLTKGSNNWAIVTGGITPSRFGGVVYLDSSIRTKNKAGDYYIEWASKDVSGTEAKINLQYIGGIQMPYTSTILTTTGNLTIGTTAASRLYLKSSNNYRWFLESTGGILPYADSAYDLGYINNRVKDGWFAGTVYAHGGNSTQWNTAYVWGNHATAGYITGLSVGSYNISVTGSSATCSGNAATATTAGNITLAASNGQSLRYISGAWRAWADSTGGTSTGVWAAVSSKYASASTFKFAGTALDALKCTKSLFQAVKSDGSVGRYGYIKSTSVTGDSVVATVVSTSALAAGDKNFYIAWNEKITGMDNNYRWTNEVPGVIVADNANYVGKFYLNTPDTMYVISTQPDCMTAASGAGAAATYNVYDATTAIYNTAPDMGTAVTLADQVPATFYKVAPGKNVTIRWLTSAGATTKCSDCSIKVTWIPSSIIRAK